MRSCRTAIALACSALLAACAAPAPRRAPPPPPDTDVSYHAVSSGAEAHYQLTGTQTAVGPVRGRDNHAPVYPPPLVARRLPPVDVRAKLIVDRHGRVSDVRFADAATADATRRVFEEAVRKAASRWTFTPLRIVQWVSTADGGQRVVGSEPKPFSQDYVFRFELRDGHPVVTSAAPPAAGEPR